MKKSLKQYCDRFSYPICTFLESCQQVSSNLTCNECKNKKVSFSEFIEFFKRSLEKQLSKHDIELVITFDGFFRPIDKITLTKKDIPEMLKYVIDSFLKSEDSYKGFFVWRTDMLEKIREAKK